MRVYNTFIHGIYIFGVICYGTINGLISFVGFVFLPASILAAIYGLVLYFGGAD